MSAAAALGGGGGGAGGPGGGLFDVASADDVGCGPGLLARPRVGSHATTHGPGPYLEADCDVASSSMAFVLVSLLQSWSKYLVIDLAFTIEPREEEAMPEAVVGCLRLSRINMDRCP